MLLFSIIVVNVELSAAELAPPIAGGCLSSLHLHFVSAHHAITNSPLLLNKLVCPSIFDIHHHHCVACPVMDVAVPTSVLHACGVEDLLIGIT